MKFIELLRDHLDAFNQAYDGQITSSMRQAIFAMLNCRSNTERTSAAAALILLISRCHVVIAVALNASTTPRQSGSTNSKLNSCPWSITW
nr:hypothetical protein BCU57_20035 [Shewanella sp. 10N.286.48.B5]